MPWMSKQTNRQSWENRGASALEVQRVRAFFQRHAQAWQPFAAREAAGADTVPGGAGIAFDWARVGRERRGGAQVDPLIWASLRPTTSARAGSSAGNGRTLHLRRSKKNKRWLWLALDRTRKRAVHFVLGGRGASSGKRLWQPLKTSPIEQVATDNWRAYQRFLPEDRHQTGKLHTQSIESWNGRLRHYLARLRRKTKCYSKCVTMLRLSILLLLHQLNGSLCMLG